MSNDIAFDGKIGAPKDSLPVGNFGAGMLEGEPSVATEPDGESLIGALLGKFAEGLVGRFPGEPYIDDGIAGNVAVDAFGNVFGDVPGKAEGTPFGNVSGSVVFGLDRRFALDWPAPFAIELELGVRNLFINGGGSARRRFWLRADGLSGLLLFVSCVYEVNEALDSASSEGNLPGSPESLPRISGAGGHSPD